LTEAQRKKYLTHISKGVEAEVDKHRLTLRKRHHHRFSEAQQNLYWGPRKPKYINPDEGEIGSSPERSAGSWPKKRRLGTA